MCCVVPSSWVRSDSATPWTVACQAPLFMGILQARILEWVAMLSSRRSSQPRIEPRSPTLQANALQFWAPRVIRIEVYLSVSFFHSLCLCISTTHVFRDVHGVTQEGMDDISVEQWPTLQSQFFIANIIASIILVEQTLTKRKCPWRPRVFLLLTQRSLSASSVKC